MAEYSNLSATINAQIRANGVQAITGPVLNAVLAAMVNVLGDGYRLKGVAAPADNPGSPDNRVAYLAAQDGTYTNFGGLVVSGEVALLLWDSAWTKETLFSIDTAVTPGSGHLVTSGAVDDALTTLAGNIAAAYMRLVPAATEGNLAEFDNAGQVRDAGLATSDVATKNGHYPDLFAGFAGNLVDTRSAGTRQGPFAFRQSGGDGVNYMRKILGRTEAFNQLVQNGNFADTSGWVASAGASFSVSGNVATATAAQSNARVFERGIQMLQGHLYYACATIKSGDNNAKRLDIAGVAFGETSRTTRQVVAAVGTWSSASGVWPIGIREMAPSDFQPFTVENIVVVDLTLEYGAGNEPATVAAFEALHPLPYYNYNAGELKNNAATGLETTGFNQWDEEWEVGAYDATGNKVDFLVDRIRSKNYIPVFPDTTYYENKGLQVYYYDANHIFISWADLQSAGNFVIPANCYYIKFNGLANSGATYNHDICINISDASRNGEYEPYWKREIVLGLDSIPCHDENNNAVVVNGLDGVGTSQDELIVENGWGKKIIKRFAEVDLGTLNWVLNATFGFIATPFPSPKVSFSAICDKYPFVGAYTNIADKTCAYIFNTDILVKDSAYTDAATFKAAMAGVKLRYELATPKVLTLDNPIPALIEVDNLGTEKRLPEDTADNPQGPFESDSNYSISTANLVRLLNL